MKSAIFVCSAGAPTVWVVPKPPRPSGFRARAAGQGDGVPCTIHLDGGGSRADSGARWIMRKRWDAIKNTRSEEFFVDADGNVVFDPDGCVIIDDDTGSAIIDDDTHEIVTDDPIRTTALPDDPTAARQATEDERMPDDLIRQERACAILACSAKTVMRRIDDGTVRGYGPKGGRMVSQAEIESKRLQMRDRKPRRRNRSSRTANSKGTQ